MTPSPATAPMGRCTSCGFEPSYPTTSCPQCGGVVTARSAVAGMPPPAPDAGFADRTMRRADLAGAAGGIPVDGGMPRAGGAPGVGLPSWGEADGTEAPQETSRTRVPDTLPDRELPQPLGGLGGAAPASLGLRLAAVLLDGLLLGLPNVIVWGVAAAVLARTSSLVLSVTVAVVAAVWTILVVLLEIVPVGRIGASLGRLLLGVRIIDARAGTTIGVGRAIVRRLVWALMAVPCYLGFISYVTDSSGYHRAWHDKAAGCVAVAAPRVPFGAAIRAVVGTLKP